MLLEIVATSINKHTGFILERSFAGFLQLEKKMSPKFYIGAQIGAHKIVSKDEY